ncbi:hypothetical protein VNI00_011846 [Paramarasmius palmivorus]|uniref:Uncharacterized protein n=1 Tax=Paramarasmius palmivorus TaxID=297713 RepID=A0AAW0CAF1_9AGAR
MAQSMSDSDFHMLLSASVPVHQEFFCRLVESYPRMQNGLLGSIRGVQNNRAKQMEMFLLRNFAEFPIHFQKRYPDVAILTERFRRNVNTVLESLGAAIEGDQLRMYITRLAECPPGESTTERDLSSISISRLWAVEVVRLQGYLLLDRDSQVDPMSTLYDTYTLNWLVGALARFLGVQVVHGANLVESANSVFDELLLGFRI